MDPIHQSSGFLDPTQFMSGSPNPDLVESASAAQQSSASMPSINGGDESMERPVGVKASKSKGKKSVDEGRALLEFQTMWEIKQQDLAMREKLGKNKLLEVLLAKTEPLSEAEMALKEKLINEMLAS